jgi:hypothetical protein
MRVALQTCEAMGAIHSMEAAGLSTFVSDRDRDHNMNRGTESICILKNAEIK